MEVIECIKERRSIRNFTEQPVSEEAVNSIVEAAAFAPSWKNTQTSRYIAVLDKDVKKQIADTCMMDFEHNINIVANAPAVIVLTTVDGRSGYERDGSFTTSKGTHWQSFDAGIAAQTFCLAANGLGMATVIMGIFDESRISEILNIPKQQSVSAVIALGYAAESPKAPVRKSTEELLRIV